MDTEFLPLREVAHTLRDEITAAALERPSQGLIFTVGPLEIEFNVVAKREGGPSGKIKFGVLGIGAELGGGVKIASEHTQKVKLTLTPEQVDASGLRSPAEISGVPSDQAPES